MKYRTLKFIFFVGFRRVSFSMDHRLWLTPLHQPRYFIITTLKLFKFVHFPAIELQYDETQLKFVSATFLWISGLILQIVTTLSSAYSVFKVIIDRLFIYKIKVFSIKMLHKKTRKKKNKRIENF